MQTGDVVRRWAPEVALCPPISVRECPYSEVCRGSHLRQEPKARSEEIGTRPSVASGNTTSNAAPAVVLAPAVRVALWRLERAVCRRPRRRTGLRDRAAEQRGDGEVIWSRCWGSSGSGWLFPSEFVGRGDMSRGGLLLRCARAGGELTYTPAAGAVRHGPRPPRLEKWRRE
jgi:hypothetical protein